MASATARPARRHLLREPPGLSQERLDRRSIARLGRPLGSLRGGETVGPEARGLWPSQWLPLGARRLAPSG